MKAKKYAKKKSANFFLFAMIVILTVIFIYLFLKTDSNIAEMEQQAMELEKAVEYQKLYNEDLRYSLENREDLLRKIARERLNYAHPEERVFVDASGIKN